MPQQLELLDGVVAAAHIRVIVLRGAHGHEKRKVHKGAEPLGFVFKPEDIEVFGAAQDADEQAGRFEVKMADIGSHKGREDGIKEQGHFVRIFVGHGKKYNRVIVQLQIDAQHGGAGDQLILSEAALAPALHKAAAEGEHGRAEIPGYFIPVFQMPDNGADDSASGSSGLRR